MLFLEQIFRLHSSIDAEKRQDYNKQNARNVKRRNKSEKEVLRRRKVVDVQNLIFYILLIINKPSEHYTCNRSK